jgi:EAL domain-containing protein (putative c-di-GMP-specific phosphodiesterase class I)
MLSSLNRQIYELDEVVFKEGDEGDCAYLIEEGVIQIIATINGQEITVDQVCKNELFGEVALIDYKPRTATARVLERAILIPIQRKMVNELLEKTNPIVRDLMLVILEHFRNKCVSSNPSAVAAQMGHDGIPLKHHSIHSEATQQLTLSNDIEHALINDQFELFYQPICVLSTRQVAGFEALIRWRHPLRGLVSPLDFLGLAEQTGQIREIGLWTLERACRDWPTLRKTTNVAVPFISVNMSPSQLIGENFIDNVKSIIDSHHMPASELKLELTETVIINNPDIALNLLRQLTNLGSTIAIDDFGTGHSTLDILNRYPLGTLKIDISFTRTMLDSERSAEIVYSSIQLAHSLDMDVVAEGVENEAVREKLLALGCNYGQGWLFGRPLPIS